MRERKAPNPAAVGCSKSKSPSPPVLPPSQARGGAGLAGGSVDSWSVARLSTRATMVSTQEAMVCASNNVLTSTIASSQSSAARAPSDLTESPVSLTQRNQVQLTPRLSHQQLLQLIRNSNGVDVDLSPDAGKENSRPSPGSGLFAASAYHQVETNLEPNDSDAEEITSDIHPIHPDQQTVLLQEQQLYHEQHQQRLPSFGKTSVIRETSLASQYVQSQQASQFKQAIGIVNGPQDLKVHSLKQEVGYPNPENQEVSFSNVGLNIIPGLNIPSTAGLSIHPINASSSVAHVPNIQTLSNSCLGLPQGTSVNISSNLGTFSTPTSSSSVIMDPQHLYQVAAAQQLVSLGQAAAAAHGGQPPPVAGLQLLNYANQNNSNANSNNGSSEHNLAVALATQNAGNNGEKSWPCPSCRIPFASAIELQAHLTTHTQKPGQVEGRNIPCDVCGRLFATQDRMKAHMRSAHQTDKNCSCSICGSGFSYRCKLLDHMRTHSGDRPFHCDVCGRGFSQKNHLTRHTMIHTGERPFSCEFCGRGFYRKDRLTGHRRTHTGWPPGEAPKASNGEQVGMALALMNQSVQQPGNNGGNSGQQANGGAGRGGRRATINPVTCHCEICGRGFTERAHLARHHMIHTGETPFICPVCQKGFYRKDKLNGHMRTHTGEKPFVCYADPNCGMGFHKKEKLADHMLTVHMGAGSALAGVAPPAQRETTRKPRKPSHPQPTHQSSSNAFLTGDAGVAAERNLQYSCLKCGQAFSALKWLQKHKCTYAAAAAAALLQASGAHSFLPPFVEGTPVGVSGIGGGGASGSGHGGNASGSAGSNAGTNGPTTNGQQQQQQQQQQPAESPPTSSAQLPTTHAGPYAVSVSSAHGSATSNSGDHQPSCSATAFPGYFYGNTGNYGSGPPTNHHEPHISISASNILECSRSAASHSTGPSGQSTSSTGRTSPRSLGGLSRESQSTGSRTTPGPGSVQSQSRDSSEGQGSIAAARNTSGERRAKQQSEHQRPGEQQPYSSGSASGSPSIPSNKQPLEIS